MRQLLSGTALIFRTHLASLVFSRRSLVALILAAGPPLLAIFPARKEHAVTVVAVLGSLMLLMVVAPLVGLLLGSAVVTEEVENRTITYVVTRPVPRAALFLGRWLATLVVTSALLAASAVAVTQVASAPRAGDPGGHRVHRVQQFEPEYEEVDSAPRSRRLRRAGPESGSVEAREDIRRDLPPGMVERCAAAATLAGALYSLLAATLGVFLKRPMIVGLGYAFAIEGFLANVPGSTQKLSLQYYLRGVLANLGKPPHAEAFGDLPMFAHTTFLTPADSALRLVIVLAIGLALGAWAIRRRQFVVTS